MITYWKKYNGICDNVSKDIKKEFNSKPVYSKTSLKTKIKSCGDESTDFDNKEIPTPGSNHTCLAVITIDSALKQEKNYYPQVFLKECKHIEKEVIRHIIGDP